MRCVQKVSRLKVYLLMQKGMENFFQGLVSLFNGISTFKGYLMPKLFSLKNSCGTIQPIASWATAYNIVHK